MKFKLNMSKKTFFGVAVALIAILSSFTVFLIANAANDGTNKIKIRYAYITGIDTGSGEFDSAQSFDNGSNNESDMPTDSNYTVPGDDNKASNRVVRSFDTLTYHFRYQPIGKNDVSDMYDNRKIKFTVTLSAEEAKYVSFGKKEQAGSTTHNYEFEGIDVEDGLEYECAITLYVLGAPNLSTIDPKFEIQESTNTDSNYVVSLGNQSGDIHNYGYDGENNSYDTTPTGFSNMMPTFVTSKKANGAVTFDLKAQQADGQKITLDNKTGRYITYVLGLKMVNVDNKPNKGIKGLVMPTGDIPVTIRTTRGTVLPENVRLYSPSANGNVESVALASPYSADTETSRKTTFPGTITLTGDNDVYTGTISNYNITYDETKLNADNSNIGNNEHYFGTYAITMFSERTTADGVNTIYPTMSVDSTTTTDLKNEQISVNGVSEVTSNNEFYAITDYSLKGEFYDMSDVKISRNQNGEEVNGYSSLSKGTSFKFKTTLNYKKTMSDSGLKEIIKVDTDALRVVAVDDERNVRIKIDGDTSLKESDFDVKFVTGSFDNSNYSVNTNYDFVNENERASISCPNNLSALNKDQIQNLYGGPCITANEGTENTYESVYKAKITNEETEEESEDPITKVIIETKDGVKLPDNVVITVEVGLRVRNMNSDITETHQVTAVAMSKTEDGNNVSYFAPRILSGNENSITDPNNYRKTTYAGNDVTSIDTDSLWGDSLKIVNFTSREVVTVTNKNTDGTVKTNYHVSKNETITYKVSTIIEDYNEQVGADDVWYIDNLKVTITLPESLNYIPDSDLGTPEVLNNGKTLVYTLPYTKPNQKIKDIYFKTNLDPRLKGSNNALTVYSSVKAVNINGEEDTSFIGYLSGSFTIYATGLETVIPILKVGDQGSVVEPKKEFSYLITAYNNTGENDPVEDYTIMDILPYKGDSLGSNFTGNYKVKITMPDSQGAAVVQCSKQSPKTLKSETKNNTNTFEDCNITDEYVSATAFRITNLHINKDSYLDNIKVSIKPTSNKYSEKFINNFVGGTEKKADVTSNEIEVRMVSRNISGRVFIDMDEDGIEEDGDQYVPNLPVTLYFINDEGKLSKVSSSYTDKKGAYKFKDLDRGKYLVRINYGSANYDVTLRYATEDVVHDSDAYKIDDKNGIAEIAYVRNIDDKDSQLNGINDLILNSKTESLENMNLGLISRKEFGFAVSKYITKVDLNTTNGNSVLNYNNEKKVKIDVKNSLKATARVYYGIKLTNDSTSAGYIKLVDEDIPKGLTFDSNDPYNKDWINTGDRLQSIALADNLIKPGETRYLQLVLDMPRQETAATFINTVTVMEIEEYIPETLTADKNIDPNLYHVGDEVEYAGLTWNVVSAVGDTAPQELTLITKDSVGTMSHLDTTSTYKWSVSKINTYLNNSMIGQTKTNSFQQNNTLNLSILKDNVICDDASGLPTASNGGILESQGFCQSNIFTTSKVRLLTEAEFNKVKQSNNANASFLNGTYWLMNADNRVPTHSIYDNDTDAITNSSETNYNPYGVETNNYYNKAKCVSNGVVSYENATSQKAIRPVITISSKNIMP